MSLTDRYREYKGHQIVWRDGRWHVRSDEGLTLRAGPFRTIKPAKKWIDSHPPAGRIWDSEEREWVLKGVKYNPSRSVKLPSKWTNAKVRVDSQGNVQIGLPKNPRELKGGKAVQNVKSVKRSK